MCNLLNKDEIKKEIWKILLKNDVSIQSIDTITTLIEKNLVFNSEIEHHYYVERHTDGIYLIRKEKVKDSVMIKLIEEECKVK